MKRIRYIKSADGTRIVRVRSIQSVRCETHDGNGFKAARIVANLKGGADPVTVAAYTAIEGSPEAENLPSRAQADMSRLLALLNGGRLRKGEEWPSK